MSRAGERAARRSLRFLWWALLSPIVGFLVAKRFLTESWPTWQVVPLAVLLAAPFVFGACYGLRAVRSWVRRGWIGLALHLLLMLTALIMPVTEALT
ncbi:MAG: hypothetical protein ACRDWS_00845 [Acidimicrobiia bacterium]